jgi:hypothetical protein
MEGGQNGIAGQVGAWPIWTEVQAFLDCHRYHPTVDARRHFYGSSTARHNIDIPDGCVLAEMLVKYVVFHNFGLI